MLAIGNNSQLNQPHRRQRQRRVFNPSLGQRPRSASTQEGERCKRDSTIEHAESIQDDELKRAFSALAQIPSIPGALPQAMVDSARSALTTYKAGANQNRGLIYATVALIWLIPR